MFSEPGNDLLRLLKYDIDDRKFYEIAEWDLAIEDYIL